MQNTHSDTHKRWAHCLSMCKWSHPDRQAGRLGHTGVCSAQIPTLKTKPRRMNALRPNRHVAILTKNTPTPLMSPPFPIHFPPKSRGIPGWGNNNAFIFSQCKGLFSSKCKSVFLWACILLWAADCSPVLWSVWLEAVQWLSSFPPVM